MDCRHPGSQDASGDIHVNPGSSAPCWNDEIERLPGPTKSPSTLFSKEVTKSTKLKSINLRTAFVSFVCFVVRPCCLRMLSAFARVTPIWRARRVTFSPLPESRLRYFDSRCSGTSCRDPFADLVLGRARDFSQERLRGEQDSRRAETALQTMKLPKFVLQRVQFICAWRQALDGF